MSVPVTPVPVLYQVLRIASYVAIALLLAAIAFSGFMAAANWDSIHV